MERGLFFVGAIIWMYSNIKRCKIDVLRLVRSAIRCVTRFARLVWSAIWCVTHFAWIKVGKTLLKPGNWRTTPVIIASTNISTYLRSWIHRLYSLLSFVVLGKAKKEQVLPFDICMVTGRCKTNTISACLNLSLYNSKTLDDPLIPF